MVLEEVRLLEKEGGRFRWGKSLEGKKAGVLSECGMKELIEGKRLFSLYSERLKRGVRVGLCDGKPCVEIQEDKEIVPSLFESFGGLMGNWVDGETL